MHIKFAIEIFPNCFIREIRENYWSRTFCDIRYVRPRDAARAPPCTVYHTNGSAARIISSSDHGKVRYY